MAKPITAPADVPDMEPGWLATRVQAGPATQLVGDREDYLANASRDVGRHVGDGQWELFVVCDPTVAMRQQFEHLRPEFIAVHDIGGNSSRPLLDRLATALGGKVQTLAIRRQGHGVPLATLAFVELPAGSERPPLRLYTTDADADTRQRHGLALELLSSSRLGVILVGELPPHALASALRPLEDAIAERPWLNRHLLMLPMASLPSLPDLAAQLSMGSSVAVRTTRQIGSLNEIWGFISGSWNHLRAQLLGSGAHLPALPGASQADALPAAAAPESPAVTRPGPLPLRPMPEIPRRGAPEPLPAAAATLLAGYALRCSELKGMLSCVVFDLATRRTVAHAGMRPGPALLTNHGAELVSAVARSAEALGLGQAPPDTAMTLAEHHLLLRGLPQHPGLVLHAVLDAKVANLMVARLQLARLDELLVPAEPVGTTADPIQ